MSNKESEIGVFGLGVMGSALSLNLADHNFAISVYNIEKGDEVGTVERFLSSNKEKKNLSGFTEIHNFVASIERPRKIIIMVSASAVDTVISSLLPHLDTDDILIDTGNSHFNETKLRIDLCRENQVDFLGVGVSGGEKGARNGPSIMPGGSANAYKKIEPYLDVIAAKDKNGVPCVTFIGPEGAGHFVKMVHNGIEYVEMQLLAEIYQLLKYQYSNEEIALILYEWNKGKLKSYLLEITTKIFRKKEEGGYLIDQILDKAGNKGTGSWSSISSLELGTDTSMMSASVFARYLSSQKKTRVHLSTNFDAQKNETSIGIDKLKKAYDLARRLNHLQGFELLNTASTEYNWNLNLSEIARIWTNGCIIRSNLMEELQIRFKSSQSLLNDSTTLLELKNQEDDLSTIVKVFADARIAAPCFSTAWNYWIGITTAIGPANLIQAQRDFFGAHTYQRIDDPTGTSYHTSWED